MSKFQAPQRGDPAITLGMFDIGQNIPSRDAVGTSVISAGNTLYFGSWGGYEYAVDATSFALRWRQYLGTTTPLVAQQCYPQSAGVSSNATLGGVGAHALPPRR